MDARERRGGRACRSAGITSGRSRSEHGGRPVPASKDAGATKRAPSWRRLPAGRYRSERTYRSANASEDAGAIWPPMADRRGSRSTRGAAGGRRLGAQARRFRRCLSADSENRRNRDARHLLRADAGRGARLSVAGRGVVADGLTARDLRVGRSAGMHPDPIGGPERRHPTGSPSRPAIGGRGFEARRPGPAPRFPGGSGSDWRVGVRGTETRSSSAVIRGVYSAGARDGDRRRGLPLSPRGG